MTKRSQHATEKKPKQILFSKNTYLPPRVKVNHWDFAVHAEKKDNYVYRDQLSNHLSTYNRWGVQDIGTGMTETRHMLAQVFNRADPVYSYKPLVNFTSYPCIDTPGRNRQMKKANLAQLPPDFGIMDYMTTHQDDYRNPFPSVTKPVRMWQRFVKSYLTAGHVVVFARVEVGVLMLSYGKHTFEPLQLYYMYRLAYTRDSNPIQLAVVMHSSVYTLNSMVLTMASPTWLLNRVIRSDLTHNHGTAPPRGDYQCLDTHTPIGHIRQLRLFRHQSFDPASGLQDFPNLKTSLDTNDKTNKI